MARKFKVKIRGKELTVQQLPNGKFKIPLISQFVDVGLGSVWLDDCKIPYKTQEDIDEASNKNRHADFGSGPRDNKIYGVDKRSRAEQGNYNASKGRFCANLLCSDDALNDGRVTGGW